MGINGIKPEKGYNYFWMQDCICSLSLVPQKATNRKTIISKNG